MTDSTVFATTLFRQLGQHNDFALYKRDLSNAEPISRSPSESDSSDSGVLPGLVASDTAMSSSSASSTELESPSDDDAGCDLDGVSTGIPSPFILSPRRLDTPCTPLLAKECGGRFPFPVMDQDDAGYDSDSDKKLSKALSRPVSAIRPRLHRAGSANWHPRLLQTQEAGRNRSRSLLASIIPPIDAAPPTAATPSPPSPTLVHADRPAKITLPRPALAKATAQAQLGHGLPIQCAVARRVVSESMPVAPRLCATPDEPRSPSPLGLPPSLFVSPQPPNTTRSGDPQPIALSPSPILPKLLRRLATDSLKTIAHLPCTPRRVFQQQRSKLAPRDAPARRVSCKKPDAPVESITSSAAGGERNPYFDGAIIVPGVGAMLDPNASSTFKCS